METINKYKTDPDTIYIYSDGSKLSKFGFPRVGAAAVAYLLGNEIENNKTGLGGHAEVFDAEMVALATAASLATNLLEDFPETSHIAFFSDSGDRTEICIGTDIAILAFSSGILKYYAPFFLNLQPIFTKIGAVTDPYSCRLNRTK
jgi:hypothetical protein